MHGKYVRISETTRILLNQAKSMYLAANPSALKQSEDTILHAALQEYLRGGKPCRKIKKLRTKNQQPKTYNDSTRSKPTK